MLDWTRLTPAVNKAARMAAANYPSHHNLSDIQQELWVWVMEKKNFVLKVLGDSQGTTVALEQIMLKVATDYLQKEDAASYGYAVGDQYNYSTDLIKSILEVIFKYEDWQSFALANDAMPRAKSDPATAGNNLAAYSDVKSAVEKLPDDYYNTIVWRYKYQYTFSQIGEEMDCTKQASQERHERAVKAIQALLGGVPLSELRNGYDGRTADAVTRGNVGGMTSQNAQYIIERDYEG